MSEENRSMDLLTRRSFIKGGAGAVVGAGCLHGLHVSAGATSSLDGQGAAGMTYVCPPCGLPCDKLTFDKPGVCPQCRMTLIPLNEAGPPKVAILLYNGVEIIDIAGPWEVFGAAGILVHTVAEKSEPLTLVFGQKTIPDYTFEHSPKADVLLVPGGGYEEQMKNDALIEWIKTKSKEVQYVMSVCTGALLLGKAGLLSGQTATCTYGMVDELARFPNTKVVYDARYVDSGKIITTAGLTSGIDGALHLVSKMLGTGEAQSAALGIEYPWDPDTGWARGTMADRFLPDGLAYALPRLKGAQAKMISTQGDTKRWETRILVSEPKTISSIIDLLRARVLASTGVSGMTIRISHLRSGPTFLLTNIDSELRWKFADDQGHSWIGSGVVESAPDDKQKFVLTLKLARDASA